MNNEDLRSNENDLITKNQMDVLQKHLRVALLGSFAFFILLILLATGISIKINDPSFGARGPFWLLIIFFVIWLFLLIRPTRQFQRIRRDLQEGITDSVTGVINLNVTSTPGFIHFHRYRIQCGENRFSIPETSFFKLRSGLVYRVYFARTSGLFLDAVPVNGSTGTTEPVSAVMSDDVRLNTPDYIGTIPENIEHLLEREQEVLELIAAGLSNQEIADRLYLSIHTIKMYASQIYQKLGVRRRTEAVQRARQIGILPPS